MNLTKGKIVAGERLLHPDGTAYYSFTVETHDDTTITMGRTVTTFSIEGFDDTRIMDLIAYLEDRPALMSESQVKEGVGALKRLLPK